MEYSFSKDYSTYSLRDFLADDRFVSWARNPGTETALDKYWKDVIRSFPEKEKDIRKALRIAGILASQEMFTHEESREESWRRVEAEISRTSTVRVLHHFRSLLSASTRYAAAALILIAVSVSFWLGLFAPWQKETPLYASYTEIHSPAGQRTQITLPDQSRIWLNAHSTIRYSAGFNVTDRDLFLEGEAYFEVNKADQPFRVETSSILVHVLGTAFNLKSYPDEEFVEATLVSGSMSVVNVRPDSGEKEEIVLQPNQKVVFKRASGDLSVASLPEEDAVDESIAVAYLPAERVELVRSYNTVKSTSWRDGLLIIDSEPLSSLSRRIGRRYDVDFVFMSEELKEFRYSGTLREYSLDQVLRAMELTSPIRFRIEGDKVYVGEDRESINRYLRLMDR